MSIFDPLVSLWLGVLKHLFDRYVALSAAGKRSREEQEAGGSGEPQNKKLKEGKNVEQPSPPLTHPHRYVVQIIMGFKTNTSIESGVQATGNKIYCRY